MPVGVLLALLTRLCLDPDRGVILLLLRKAETGEAISSFGVGPLLLRTDSGRGMRRGTGVTRATFGCNWAVAVREAIFGVRGGLLLRPLATVGNCGCREEDVEEDEGAFS